ncbi:MAG: class I SAM-dependent methyltransferase [Nitrososphaerales archaeon]
MSIEPFKYIQAKWVYGYHQPMEALRRLDLGKDSSLLVLGAGFGKTSLMAAEKIGCSIIGAEIAPRLIESANKRVHEKELTQRVRFQALDPGKPFLDAKQVDGILFESILSFMKDPIEVLSYYTKMLKSKGKIAILELYFPDENPREEAVNSARKIFGESAQFKSAETWQGIFNECKLQVEGFYPRGISMRRKFWDDLLEEPLGTWIELAKTLYMTYKDPGAKKSLDLFREFFKEHSSTMLYGYYILTKN